MRPKIAQIKITKPCSESWEEMRKDDKGKHCAKCKNLVVDFTQMTDNAIVEYLRNNRRTCGRFYEHQLERDFMLFPETSQWRTRISKVAASVLLLSQLEPKKTYANTIVRDTLVNNYNSDGVSGDTMFNDTSRGDKIVQYAGYAGKGEHRMEVILQGNASLEAFSLDEHVVKASAWKAKFIIEKEAFKVRLQSDNSWNWGWLTLFVFSLSFLIRWFFTGQHNGH